MINYICGDATDPKVEGMKIIAHVCNDIGLWGKGFVLAVSNKWSDPRDTYRFLHSMKRSVLGQVQYAKVSDDIVVANMIAQRGIISKINIKPIRYDALEGCLEELKTYAQIVHASVHMPRIGCGLAGGIWSEVEPIITRVLVDNDVQTYVYDFIS